MPILKVAVSAALLYILFSKVDARLVWDSVSSVGAGWIVSAALLFAALQCISTYRWSIVLGRDVHVPYPRLLSMYFVGMFFNSFLPTIVGGDVVKGYYLYRETGRGGAAFASILMDRYSGFAALMTITFVALLIGGGAVHATGGTGLVVVFAALVGGFLGASLFLWFERLHQWLVSALSGIRLMGLNEKVDAFYRTFTGYRQSPSMLVGVFLISLAIQCGVITGYFMLGRGMGVGVPIGYFFLFVPLATTASMIPLSLSGLGIREGVFVFLFSRAGMDREDALALSLLWFLVTVVVSLPGAVEYIRRGPPGDVPADSNGDHHKRKN